MGRGDLLIGLGVGLGIGFGVGYLVVQWRQATQATLRLPPPLPPGMMTDFTRDESGRVISIIEKPIR
jgi:hypothetical protein